MPQNTNRAGNSGIGSGWIIGIKVALKFYFEQVGGNKTFSGVYIWPQKTTVSSAMSVFFQRKVFANQIVSAAITLWKKVLHPPTSQVQNATLFYARLFGTITVLRQSTTIVSITRSSSTSHVGQTLGAIWQMKTRIL